MKKLLIVMFLLFLLTSCTSCSDMTLPETFPKDRLPDTSITISSHEPVIPQSSEKEETTVTCQTNSEFLNLDYDKNATKYEMLYPVFLDGYYEYIDKNGNVITHGQYNKAYNFSDEMAIVSKGGLYGVIDLTGQIFINYQPFEIGNFNCGLAYIVNAEGRYGYIDKMGKLKIDYIYNRAYDFSNGVAKIDYDDYTNGKYIDINGNTVIEYNSLSPSDVCNDNLIKIGWVYYNIKTGKWVEGEYVETSANGSVLPLAPYDFSDGLAVHPITNDNKTKWMYIDIQGEMAFNNIFDEAGAFSEGLAVVKQNGKTGVIDKTGNFVFYNDNVDLNHHYSEGMLPFRDEKSNKVGFLDKKGNITISAKYDSLYSNFENGLAVVELQNKLLYIDHDGNTIFTFDKPIEE